ncbi:MAG: YicC/YloC family endoribonuclease [Candidatus Zixiibacteriota bacterium]
MLSMTGYGKADIKKRKLAVAIELFSVNSRFLEFSFRMPKQLAFLEPRLKKLIASKIDRGKISVNLNYSDYGTGIDKLAINENLVGEIHKQLSSLKKKFKLAGEIELGHILGFQEIFKVDKSEDIEEIVWPVVETAANQAIKELINMRQIEGANLKKDLQMRLDSLTKLIAKIEKFAPQNVQLYRERLTKRIEELSINGGAINGARLEEEVTFQAERSDITEECVRFRSHLEQLKTALSEKDSIGKRLNFILQELNREANTIGSKGAGTSITKVVLDLKEEIEKMREQIQNIE